MNMKILVLVGVIIVMLIILTCYCNLNNIKDNFKTCKVDNDCVNGYTCSNNECIKIV